MKLFRVGGHSLQLSSDVFSLGDDLVNVAEMGDLCQVTRERLELEDLGKKNNSLEVSKV